MNKKIKKQIPLVGSASAYVDMQSGSSTIAIPDIMDDEMNVQIVHLINQGNEDFNCGEGVRLNFHEKLVKEDGGYIYTDDLGESHTVTESFYYVNEDGERQIISDKNSIMVNSDGMLYLSNKTQKVYREEKTDNGLKAATILEGISNIESLEQRTDEQKQLEDQIKGYEKAILNFTIANESGENETTFLTIDDLIVAVKNMTGNEYCLSKSEAHSLNALVVQRLSLSRQIAINNQMSSIYGLQSKDFNNQISILSEQGSLLRQRTDASFEQLCYLFGLIADDNAEDDGVHKQQIFNYVIVDSNGNIIYRITPVINNNQAEEIRLVDRNGNSSPALDETNCDAELINRLTNGRILLTKEESVSYNSILTQLRALSNSKSMLLLQKETIAPENAADLHIDDQKANTEQQISFIQAKSANNRNDVLNYYKEYLLACNKLDNLKLRIPVNFIITESFVKGFNSNGALVTIYGPNNKYLAIEHEYCMEKTKTRISRIYDQKEREIRFLYDDNTNMLSEIKNSYGEIVGFRYYLNEENSSYVLNKIIFPSGKNLDIEVGKLTYGQDFTNIVRNEDKVTEIENCTYVNSVSHDNVETSTISNVVNKFSITYNDLKTIVIDNLFNQFVYIFNENNQVIEYIEIIRELVRKAIKYEYTEELLTKIIYPKQNCLNVNYSVFDFVEDYSKTINYDSFERVESETVGWITISEAVKKQAKTTYTYDKNKHLVKLYTVVSTENNGTVEEITESTVQLFEYDKNGKLLCEKNYTEGKELVSGIAIKEYVYNDNGYQIKSVTYNSLAPSSKLYEEKDVNEDGQVLVEYDQCGINKTIFEGDTAIQANGTRLSYGYSVKDGNSAITMSTEDGEGNSTQILYTNGLATEVISGDDVYDYTYDYRGRVTNVKINGVDHVNYTYSEAGPTSTVTAIFADGHSETEYVHPTGVEKTIIDGCNSKFIVKQRNNETSAIVAMMENNVTDAVTNYTYDNQGKLVSVVVNKASENIYSESYTYNNVGNLMQKNVTSENSQDSIITYEYNENTQKLIAINCAGATRIEPKVDCLGRNRGKTVSWLGTKIYSEDITYLKHGDHATSMPLTISYGNNTENGFVVKDRIKYKYDEMGNICEAYENGQFVTEYKYDALGRLVRENNKKLGKTFVFSYDNKGNIVTRTEYAFTLKDDDFVKEATGEVFEYVYSGEKLVSYNGEAFAYDDIGNPTTYRGNTLTWRFGRRLTSFGSNTFDYNAEGKRIKKNDISYIYDSQGRLFAQSNGIEYFYDENSSPIAFAYNGEVYYYKKDLLGNVIEILDTTGATVVKYAYDAWGNHKVRNPDGTENTSAMFIGNINLIRYRSYYYDTETGLYFLQTRYYDPQTGRFINIDDISYLEPETINGLNLYAYCGNDPVNYFDPTGHSAILIGLIIGAIVGAGIGFGTVAYTDYQDDGQIFNGSVKWYEYVGGTVTGAVLGAGVGGIIGAGGAVLTSAMSSVANKFITDLFAYTLTGTSFGTWEDYAVAFISGGLIKGLGMKGIVQKAYDVVGRPLINQVVKIGTNRTETFNFEKYVYDVVTRGLTTFAPSPWKAFYRGGFRSMWDLYKRGCFA